MTKLKKKLGFFDLYCISSGAMISSGLFILPGIAYTKVGSAAFLSYIIASFLVIPAMLSKAELATAMPKTGGTYFYVERSMGPAFGTLAGLSSWFSLSFKSAFALLGIGAFSILIYPEITSFQVKLIASIACLLFAIINIFSAKHAGNFQVILVIGLIIILLIYIALSFPHVDIHNFKPFLKVDSSGNQVAGFRELIATAGLIFISFGGLTKVVSLAEEVKDPAKNIPYSMLASFITVSILYALTVFVTVGILGDALGQRTLTPISDGAKITMGNTGMILLAIAAILAFISTGNAGIMTASRAPMAMSQDKLLPQFFSKLHPKLQTPINSIIITTIFMLIVIIALDLEILIKTASTIMILLFASVNLAVILMRESRIQNYQPKFKSPLYPWMQIAGLFGYGFLLYEMGFVPIAITGCFFLIGLFWYWVYGRVNSSRVSALLHIVRRLTAREMRYDLLNSELKEILQERDDIIEDEFDRLVKNAHILNMEKEIEFDKLMTNIADILAPQVNLKSEEIKELLINREKESSTVLTAGLAVPHIIIPGDNKFVMVMIRCRDGVRFPQIAEPVNALFVLSGTRDQRNLHLKVLMSVAQIVQQKEFRKKWLNASHEKELRDFILLSERKREDNLIS